MRALNINLKPRAAHWARILLCACFLVLLLLAREGWLLFQLRQQQAELSGELMQVQAAITQASGKAPVAMTAPPYAPDAARIRSFAARDLAGVLAAVEGIRCPGVKVRSVDWDATTGIAQVELEAQDMAQLLACIKLRNDRESVKAWTITRAAQSSDGTGVVLASIVGKW